MRKFWRDKWSMVDSQWSMAIQISLSRLQWTMDHGLWTITLLGVVLSCAQPKKEATTEKYTCPMHPEIIQDKPGTCPICFMDLVRKNREGEGVEITAELNYLLKPTNAQVMSSIKTVMPTRESNKVTEKFNGIITYDTRKAIVISSRVGGRIEKLFVKYKFQPIRRGQKILELYSPELITAQRDLVFLIQTDPENTALINSAKEKLRLIGATEDQIAQTIASKKEMNSFPVFSSADGYVTDEGEKEQNELFIREGMYLSTGQTIVKVINTQEAWAEFDIAQSKMAGLKLNDPIRIAVDDKNEIEAKVNFVQPFFKVEEKFTKVRVYLANPNNKYKIGQLVEGSLDQVRESLWIPASARLDLGTKEIAFVKKEGAFKSKLITTTRSFGDKREVVLGLSESDSIAYDAHFLIDSESFVKVNE